MTTYGQNQVRIATSSLSDSSNHYASRFGSPVANQQNQFNTGFGGLYGQNQEAFFALQREFIKYQFQAQLFSPQNIKAASKAVGDLFGSIGSLFSGGGGGGSCGSGGGCGSSGGGGCSDGSCNSTWVAKTDATENKPDNETPEAPDTGETADG